MPEKQSFAECLRKIRSSQKISLRSLASSAGMDPAYLSRIENGKTGVPKQETVEKLAQALCEQQQLEPAERDRQQRALLEASGHLQAKEDLIDDLADRFAGRLRDEGFPENRIDEALIRVSLPTMRAVLLGEEKLEIGYATDYSPEQVRERLEAGEEIVEINAQRLSNRTKVQQQSDLFASKTGDSARSYLDRHAEPFRTRRGSAAASRGRQRVIRAGREASIHVNEPMSKAQERQLRHIARLISAILQEK